MHEYLPQNCLQSCILRISTAYFHIFIYLVLFNKMALNDWCFPRLENE